MISSDLADLLQVWQRRMDVLRVFPCPPGARRCLEAFDAIVAYLHDGEPPWIPEADPDAVLVRVTTEGRT